MSTVTVVVNSVGTNALDRYTGAKGVTALCSSVSRSVRQTTTSAFTVPRSKATEAVVESPLTVAPMQQKRGSKVEPAPQVDEEVAETVIFRLGPSQIVETPTSHPRETVGRRVLGTDNFYVESEKLAYHVLKKDGKWPEGRLNLVDVPIPRPVGPVTKKN